ncbi:MAG: DUF2017 family protein [Planctomycetota bacterium]
MYLTVRRDENEGFVLEMSSPLFHYLHLLPAKMRAYLDAPDYESRALRRLFPPGYSDPDKEDEYRELVRGDLLQQRREKVDSFEELLTGGTVSVGEASLQIPADRFDACLTFLNDLRVLVGEELEIEDEEWDRDFDPADPRADQVLMLHLLGTIQQGLLEATGMVDIDIRPEDIDPSGRDDVE